MVATTSTSRRRSTNTPGAPLPWMPGWRLSGQEAYQLATKLERRGWRAEQVPALSGEAWVTVRDLAVRGHPVVATIRTTAEARRFLAEHPAHGLKGRLAAPPAGASLRDYERDRRYGPRFDGPGRSSGRRSRREEAPAPAAA